MTLTDRTRLWLLISIVLAVVGVGLSAYSVNHHRAAKASGQTDAACNINATFSCDEIALSKYSEVGNIPLGVYGFGYFAGIIVLAGIGLTGNKSAKEHIHALVVMIFTGVVVSAVLASIAYFAIGKGCIVCIGVYIVCFALLGTWFAFRKDVPGEWDAKTTFSGGTTAAIAVALVAAAYSYLMPAVQPMSQAQTKPKDPNAPLVEPKKNDIQISRSAYSGLGEDYRKGPDNAPVVIVEWADLQCPACKQMDATLKQLLTEYDGKLQVVFRNYPLDSSCNDSIKSKMHEFACNAAIISRCAGQAGKFWEFHEKAFAGQKEMSNDKLKTWAKEVGLSDDQIASCLASPDLLAKVKDDIKVGNEVGVDSTPTLFINGQKAIGRSLSDLRTQLDSLTH